MSGKVTGVDFVILPTQDIERAIDFYENVLGLERGKQWGEMPAHEFETGSLTIAVVDPTCIGQKFAPHPFPVALRVDDVEAMRAKLTERGVTFGADTIDSGVCLMAIFHDPDGNSLMLHRRYAPAA